jgi:hypothetical protein
VAPWSSLMVPYMRAGGKKTNETGRVERFVQTEISMMATGRMVSFMDLASSPDKTETDMKETGESTSSTVEGIYS